MVGNLFGQKSKINRKRELVILIKPTVIPADGRWPAELSAPKPAGAVSPNGTGPQSRSA